MARTTAHNASTAWCCTIKDAGGSVPKDFTKTMAIVSSVRMIVMTAWVPTNVRFVDKGTLRIREGVMSGVRMERMEKATTVWIVWIPANNANPLHHAQAALQATSCSKANADSTVRTTTIWNYQTSRWPVKNVLIPARTARARKSAQVVFRALFCRLTAQNASHNVNQNTIQNPCCRLVINALNVKLDVLSVWMQHTASNAKPNSPYPKATASQPALLAVTPKTQRKLVVHAAPTAFSALHSNPVPNATTKLFSTMENAWNCALQVLTRPTPTCTSTGPSLQSAYSVSNRVRSVQGLGFTVVKVVSLDSTSMMGFVLAAVPKGTLCKRIRCLRKSIPRLIW